MFQDQLETYLRERNPVFDTEKTGVPRMLVDELESTLGTTLPKSYRNYMESMGFDHGGIEFKDRELDVIDVESYVASAHIMYPSRYGMLAIHHPPPGVVSSLHWFFDFERRGVDDCPIVAFDDQGAFDENIVMPVYGSFQELVAEWAFRMYSMAPKFRSTELQYLEADAERRRCLQHAVSTLKGLGYRTVLPPTQISWLAELEGHAAMVRAMPHHRQTFFVEFSSDDDSELRRLEDALTNTLGAPCL